MLSFICVCSLDLLLAETLNRGLGLGTARVHHLGARVPFLVRLLPALRHPSLLFNMDLCSNAHTVRLATGWRPRLLSVPFPCSSLRLCAPSPNPALLCVTAAPVQASRDAPKTSRPSPPLPSSCPHRLSGRHWPSPQGRLCCSKVADLAPSHPAPDTQPVPWEQSGSLRPRQPDRTWTPELLAEVQ